MDDGGPASAIARGPTERFGRDCAAAAPGHDGCLFPQDKDYDMSQARGDGPQASDLARFLYAEAGTQANSVAASVLSVLARRGVDPWNEAARLSDLPRRVAADELARVLADEDPPLSAAPRDTAEHLVLLLPAGGRNGGVAEERTIGHNMLRVLLLLGAFGAILIGGAAELIRARSRGDAGGGATTVAAAWAEVIRMRERGMVGSVQD